MTTAYMNIVAGGFMVDYPNTGRSAEADNMSRIKNEIDESLSGSITFGIKYNRMLRSIIEACRESSKDDWDGYGAKAISWKTCMNAAKFLQMLPSNFPSPEIDVEPNGGFLLEWHNNIKRIFSAIVESDNRITYAGLFGENKTYGTERFENELPKPILENLQRVFSQS